MLYRSSGAAHARLGLAIGKKHCRLASRRNRLKRVVRESFREHSSSLGNIDVVVMNNEAAQAATNATLFDSLEKHWRRCRSSAGQT